MSRKVPKAAAKAEKQTESRDRYYLLYQLFHSITRSTLEPARALELIIDAGVQITGATKGSIVLVNWEQNILEIAASKGFVDPVEKFKMRIDEGITGWVAQNGEPLLIPDVSQDDRYVQLDAEIRSELAVPLKIDDQLIGVLNVDSIRLNAFGSEDLDFLTLLSQQSAQVIRNGRLFETVRQKAEQLSALIDINKTINSPRSLDKILRQIVTSAARLTHSKICAVRLLSDDREELVLRAQHGGSPDYSEQANIRISRRNLGRIIHKRQPLHLEDIRKDEKYGLAEFANKEKVRTMLAMPLVTRNKAIGMIQIFKTRRYSFSEEEVLLLNTFSDLCAISIENARLYNKMLTLEEQFRFAERLAAVGELSAGIAHEIRNPLTIVKMIFDSEQQLNDRDREIISEELDRMNKIITNLLDYARPQDPVRELCNVNRILDTVGQLLSHAFERKEFELKTNLYKRLPKIEADPVQLQQVFLNIFMNSREAIQAGGSIEVETGIAENDMVYIVFRDDGSGFPESVVKNLFVPFTTTKRKGLGLGLSIIKRIVNSHQGTIQIQNRPQGGAQVRIELPVKP